MEIPRHSVYIHWGRLGEFFSLISFMLQITHQKSQKMVFWRLSRKEKNHEPKHRDLTHELERWRELVRTPVRYRQEVYCKKIALKKRF